MFTTGAIIWKFNPNRIKKKFLFIYALCLSIMLMSLLITATPARAQGKEDPIIVWIVFDTLRADHLGSYGYPRNTSPNLDQLAVDGVRFENAVAPSSWTLPSFTSMLTGLNPVEHNILLATDYYSGNDEMLAEIIKKNGFTTVSFQTNKFVSDSYGILRGFDTKLQYNRDDLSLTQNVIDWLSDPNNISGKTFLFIGYMSPHAPYFPPDNYLL